MKRQYIRRLQLTNALLVVGVILYLLLGTGCATLRFDKGAGCTTVRDYRAPEGWTVYSCPHRFTVPSALHNDRSSVETAGVTYCAERAVYFYESRPEVLEHEYRHARACSTGGGQH